MKPGTFAVYFDAATVVPDVTFASCAQECGEERGVGSVALVKGIYGPPQIGDFEGDCYCFNDFTFGAGVGDGESLQATYAEIELCDGISYCY